MYLYTYNRHTLTYQRINVPRYAMRTAAIVFAALSLVSINVMDAGEYERILEVRMHGNEFSEERLRAKLNELNVRFVEIAVAQAKLETNNFRSKIFLENHNLFGMKQAKSRANMAKGTQYGHAYYNSWEDSVVDYALWVSAYANRCRTKEQMYALLDGYYAEDNSYISKLKSIQ
jgi:uncharacterized FlgJ-related protein